MMPSPSGDIIIIPVHHKIDTQFCCPIFLSSLHVPSITPLLILSLLLDEEECNYQSSSCISAADISYAEKLNFTIKLLAIAKRVESADATDTTDATDATDRLQLRVHPTLVPKTHPLASINGVYNAILVEGEPLGQVMFYGPGAGAGPTASAVVSDILSIAAILKTETEPIPHPLLSCTHQHYCAIAPMADLVSRFYVRFLTKDKLGVIGDLGTTFGKHGVSIESVVQTGIQEHLVEIVVVTHDVREGNFHQALDEIRQLEAFDSIPSVLRVL